MLYSQWAAFSTAGIDEYTCINTITKEHRLTYISFQLENDILKTCYYLDYTVPLYEL